DVAGVTVTAGAITTQSATLATTGATLTVNLDPTAGSGAGPTTLVSLIDAAGVAVRTVPAGPYRTSADRSATATIHPLAAGSYTLLVAVAGAPPTTQPVTVASGGTSVT